MALYHSLSAQEQINDSNGQWGLRAGWTQSLVHDQHTSPLLYQSDRLAIGGIYRSTHPFFLEISLGVSIGPNQPRNLGQRTGEVTEPADIYGTPSSYEIKAYPFFSRLDGQLSVRARWALNNRHQLGVSLNARHIYTGMGIDDWHYTQVDLAPEYAFQYGILRGDLEFSASLPLLAGVVRPNYAFDPSLPDLTNYYRGYLRTSSEITSIHRLFNPRVRAGYTWRLSKEQSIGVHYRAQWTSYPDPRPLRMFDNGIDLSYFF
jgi:hypothetical protein